MEPQNENSAGPVIGLIIILTVIILGGFYFWGTRDNNAQDDAVPVNTATDTSAIDSQSNSDDTASIENDLNNTNTDDLDSELQAS